MNLSEGLLSEDIANVASLRYLISSTKALHCLTEQSSKSALTNLASFCAARRGSFRAAALASLSNIPKQLLPSSLCKQGTMVVYAFYL